MGVFGLPAVASSVLMVLMFVGQILRRLLDQVGIVFLAGSLRIVVVFHEVVGRWPTRSDPMRLLSGSTITPTSVRGSGLD